MRRSGVASDSTASPSDVVFADEHDLGSVPQRRDDHEGRAALPADEERRVSHWTDAHCHLQDQFLGDEVTTAKLLDTLARAYEGGVDRVVVIGTDATTSAQALEITGLEGPVEIYATVGLHPHDAAQDIEPVLALARRRPPETGGNRRVRPRLLLRALAAGRPAPGLRHARSPWPTSWTWRS